MIDFYGRFDVLAPEHGIPDHVEQFIRKTSWVERIFVWYPDFLESEWIIVQSDCYTYSHFVCYAVIA